MSTFAKRLRKLRKQNEFTQKELGEKIDLGKSSISHLENGKNEPNLETIRELARIFDCTTDYLLGETDYKDTSRLASENRQSKLRKLKEFMDEMDVDYIEVIDEAREEDLSPDEIRFLIDFYKNNKNMIDNQG